MSKIDDDVTHLRVLLAEQTARAIETQAVLLNTVALAEAERDAAVARNIILHQQMTAQEAQDAADRIPVADWTFRLFTIFDEAVERIGRSRGPDEWSAKLLEDVRTRIADLPGWNGSEGCLPSAFMLRDEHDRQMIDIADAMHGPTLQPLAERVRGYVETCDRLNAIIGALTAWAHEYGAALKPPGADTYGEGKRDAKNEVAAILRGKA